jgi:hypothetical protein
MSTTAQQWIVDAIEELSASVELPGGGMVALPRSVLPRGARSGHVLRVTIEIDEAATRAATAASAAQVEKGSAASRKRDPGGDISL